MPKNHHTAIHPSKRRVLRAIADAHSALGRIRRDIDRREGRGTGDVSILAVSLEVVYRHVAQDQEIRAYLIEELLQVLQEAECPCQDSSQR